VISFFGFALFALVIAIVAVVVLSQGLPVLPRLVPNSRIQVIFSLGLPSARITACAIMLAVPLFASM
jgi:hypothetical protein